jgi:hypothetical protein
MAEDAQTENARRQLAADRELSDKSRAEYAERMKGRPTPTQEENDMAILGANKLEHEDDGSGPDPNVRSLEGRPAAGYQTRSTQAQPHRAPPRQVPTS